MQRLIWQKIEHANTSIRKIFVSRTENIGKKRRNSIRQDYQNDYVVVYNEKMNQTDFSYGGRKLEVY